MDPDSRLAPVFKAYDIRGTVPDQLDERIVHSIGHAFAEFVRNEDGASRVLIGRDMRESGLSLSEAFTAGVQRAGLGVVDAGLVSTDLMYFSSGALALPGAMLTASHNPASYNGIKLCRSGARPIGRNTGLQQIRRRAEEASRNPASSRQEVDAGKVEHVDLLAEFARHVHSFVDVDSLRPLRVIADTANGMGGIVAPAVLGGLGLDLEILYGELDGSFPNHPADPIQPENLVDLRERVRQTGADVGLAFDGDADRVFLVDEKTEPLSGSVTTAIVAAEMLQQHPGETILYNLVCSKAVPEVIAERGGTAVRTRVGHSFIKELMATTGAIFGGEHSGHYYFRENYRADSGIIAAIIVLSVMSKAGLPLSELRMPFERYCASGEINTEVGDADVVLAGVHDTYARLGAKIDHLDGLSVDMGQWWFNLRPSNTEPLLRLNLEARDAPSCRERVSWVLALVRDLDRRKESDDAAR